MPYMSPSLGFSDAIEQTLATRAALEHQKLIDNLAIQREANTAKWHQDEVDARKEEAGARRADLLERANERDRLDFEKRVSGMLPGDVPDPEMIAQDAKFKTGFFKGNVKPPVAPMADTTTMPGMISQGEPGGPQKAPLAAGTPQTPMDAPDSIAAPAPAGSVYLGNRQDRLKAQQDQKAAAIIARIKNLEPGSPEFQQAVLEHESLTGKNVSANFSKAPVTKKRFVFDPIKKTYSDLEGNVVTELPPDAVVDRSAEPHTSGDDTKKATQLQHAYDAAVKEWNDSTKTAKGHLDAVSELGGILDIASPQADTLVAPLVLKATVSGQGSGFRMTRAEIDNVLHGRSKWEDLQAAMQKWSTDPSKANQLTPDQRQQMRDLAKSIGDKSRTILSKAQIIRDQIDEATDPSEIKKLRSNLQKVLTAEPEKSEKKPTTLSFEELTKKYGGDQ